MIITQALYPLQAEALFLLFPTRQLGSGAALPALVLKTWNTDLAHGDMEGTRDPLLVPKQCLPDFLPLLRNKAGILPASSTGSRSWSFNEIKFNITLH